MNSTSKSEKGGKKVKRDNDWIPTESVRAIQKIREDFKGNMSETCISQILYELNSIWRNLMRKENEAIKKRLTGQIQDLRRQVVTKQAFDKSELMSEITRTKKELAFANKHLHNTKASHQGGDDSRAMQDNYNSEIERSIKVVETIGIQKKVLEDENEELRSRITDLEHERENMKAHVKKRMETNQTLTSPTSNGVPPLNLAKTSGERHYL